MILRRESLSTSATLVVRVATLTTKAKSLLKLVGGAGVFLGILSSCLILFITVWTGSIRAVTCLGSYVFGFVFFSLVVGITVKHVQVFKDLSGMWDLGRCGLCILEAALAIWWIYLFISHELY